jgi:hypothetical protein
MCLGIVFDDWAAENTLIFRELRSGLQWFEGGVEIEGDLYALRGIRLNNAQYSVKVATENPIGSGLTVLEYQQKFKAYAALSGGFMKSFYPPLPLGFVKSNGKIINREHDPSFYSGIVCSKQNALTIEPFTGRSATEAWTDCLQSGPLLLYRGRPAVEFENYPDDFLKAHNRAFIAVDAQQRVILGVTEKITISVLLEVLQMPVEQGGLGCRGALNLSGDYVGIVTDVAGKSLTGGDVEIYPPNALIVK